MKTPDQAPDETGLREGGNSCGDKHFPLFLRKAFIKADQGVDFDFMRSPVVTGKIPRG